MNIRFPIVALALTFAVLPIGTTSDVLVGWFSDVTAASGLTFTHFNGMSGKLYYPEIIPPQRRRLHRSLRDEPRIEPAGPKQLQRNLHRRHQAKPSLGNGRFEEITGDPELGGRSRKYK